MSESILKRETFKTDRTLEFFSEKELQMQIGHYRDRWPIAMVKELIDNSLDACETAGIPPSINIQLENNAVSVQDNGPGLPDKTLEESLNYLVRVSDKNHYVSPSRGQLGNALKCLYAVPFVMNGDRGRVDIITGDKKHQIDVSVDRIAQRPKIKHTVSGNGFVKKGTFIKMHTDEIACVLEDIENRVFYNLPVNISNLIRSYAVFNPHISITYNSLEFKTEYDCGVTDWSKWYPSFPTSPHWYSVDRLRGLIAAYIYQEHNSGKVKTVREFVAEFKGLTSTGKQKQVTAAVGLSRAYLHDLVNGDDVNIKAVEELLLAMKDNSKPVKPKSLGVIGEDHITSWMVQHYIAPDSIKYKMICGETRDLPYVLEVAFGVFVEKYGDCSAEVVTGLNWSPTLSIPFDNLISLLGEARIDGWDQVRIVVHLTCPRLDFTDRGKSKLQLPPDMQEALQKAVRSVTKHFTSEKRKADRQGRLHDRQVEELRKAHKRSQLSARDAAFEVMEEAYMKASANNTLPANARQIMYAARPLIINMTGKVKPWKDSAYFTQHLLPDFLEANPQIIAEWDVVYDARGKLVEPHTGRRVDLGTLDVRRYVNKWSKSFCLSSLTNISMPNEINTYGPANRYKFALFVEKEGFDELWKSVDLANRFDLAIMSTKGMSVTAARALIEKLTEKDVTILVLRDFDKAGFSIVHTLRTNTRRWMYETTPNIMDLGLRLKDVQGMDLENEDVTYDSKIDPRINLIKSGATEEELNYLVDGGRPGSWHGKRVELNAMDSAQFVEWLEKKLKEIDVCKVVPDSEILEQAYRQAHRRAFVESAIQRAIKSYNPDKIIVPDNLSQLVEVEVEGTKRAWENAVTCLVNEK